MIPNELTVVKNYKGMIVISRALFMLPSKRFRLYLTEEEAKLLMTKLEKLTSKENK